MSHEKKSPENSYDGNEELESSEKTSKDLGKKALEEYQAGYKERAKEHVSKIREIQTAFVEKIKAYEKKGTRPSDFVISNSETDLFFEWRHLEGEESSGGILHDDEKRAEVEEDIFFLTGEEELHRTVEAQSGRFFRERAIKLREAIENGDKNEKTKQHEIELIEKFEKLAKEHIDLKYHENEYSEQDAETWNDYERHRTQIHNDTIDALNYLNDLSREYKLTPFTPRNFWSSARHEAKTVAERKRLRYDRDVVEEYYSIAFSEALESAQEDFMKKRAEKGNIGTDDARKAIFRDAWTENIRLYNDTSNEDDPDVA